MPARYNKRIRELMSIGGMTLEEAISVADDIRPDMSTAEYLQKRAEFLERFGLTGHSKKLLICAAELAKDNPGRRK